jgi:hypothetical protein
MHAWGPGGRAIAHGRSDPAGSDVAASRNSRRAITPAIEGAHASIARRCRCGPRGGRIVGPGFADGRAARGFLELTTAATSVGVNALVDAGCRSWRAAPSGSRRVHRYVAPTPRDEVRAALEWARARALADGTQAVGIAVADLAMHRDEVRAAADDVLCPALQVPATGARPRPYTPCRRGARPVDLRAWCPCALDVVALGTRRSGPCERAAAAGAFAVSRWDRGRCARRVRASLDRRGTHAHRVEGLRRTRCLPPVGGGHARRGGGHPFASAVPRRHSSAHWRKMLDRCGWPGNAPLDGARYETRTGVGAAARRLRAGRPRAAAHAPRARQSATASRHGEPSCDASSRMRRAHPSRSQA